MAKHLPPILFTFVYLLVISFAAKTSSDLIAAESIATGYKAQSVDSSKKYGYPFMIAPTLEPRIQSRSDDDIGDEASQSKSYGSRIPVARNVEKVDAKSSIKKSKVIFPSDVVRHPDGQETPVEKRFRSYKQPKYRNFEELEAAFQPRRMDINIPYSQYDYSKFLPKATLSPRDPFLSPSSKPVDSFYPSSPKIKHNSGYGKRQRGRKTYGAGTYDDALLYHDDSFHGLGGPSSGYTSSKRPSSGYSSSGEYPFSHPSSGGLTSGYQLSGGHISGYPSSGGSYGNQNYEIKSNEPIVGNIRKRLLDYAGASDLYEGEPDYLQEISRSKNKYYENIGNDYYAYGGPGHRGSYSDFPYIESKISLIKKSRRV